MRRNCEKAEFPTPSSEKPLIFSGSMDLGFFCNNPNPNELNSILLIEKDVPWSMDILGLMSMSMSRDKCGAFSYNRG